MKSIALLAALLIFPILTSTSSAQGVRSSPTGSGRWTGAGPSGAATTQTRVVPAGPTTTITLAPPQAVTVPSGHTPATPTVTTQRFVPPAAHSGSSSTLTPNTVRHPPVKIIETTTPSHHPHRRHRPVVHHHHHPGIIIDTPYFYPRTIVTETAPGVLRQVPPYAEPPPAESRTRSSGQLAPFDPTPQEVVERMLRMAALKTGDLLYDLGSGDGRVVIAAAKKFGVKAVGFEIDPGLVKLARENARKQGVEHLVEIRQQDFLTADLSLPSVVTLYLSYDGNQTVRPRLMSQLKAGARVVSYTFDMAEWQAKAIESYRDGAGNSHMIYLWEIGGALVFSDGGR